MTNELWGVFKGNSLVQIYTTEEGATIVADFCNKKINPSQLKSAPRFYAYTVKKIFQDCYVNKIKKGYNVFLTVMYKDGAIVEEKVPKEFYISPYGFRKTFIYNPGINNNKLLYYYDLCKDQAECNYKANQYRLSTLLDDVWDNKKEVNPNDAW